MVSAAIPKAKKRSGVACVAGTHDERSCKNTQLLNHNCNNHVNSMKICFFFRRLTDGTKDFHDTLHSFSEKNSLATTNLNFGGTTYIVMVSILLMHTRAERDGL
ncbi:hypothetical protein GQR58_001126 [Nymphon striatum]|nr:hypothetical protein GQR58_001126 [Nymphon striatum]